MRRVTLALFVVGCALIQMPTDADARVSENVLRLQQVSDGIAEVAALVKPGVVAIVAEGTVTVTMRDPFSGTPFERLFGNPHGRGPQGPREREMPRSGQGSGVIVQHKGDIYILTNNHVVQGSSQIQVQLADDRYFAAEIVGTDSLSDIAVLSVKATDLPTVAFGHSADLRDGEMVLAVGNPLGYRHSITYGIVSAMGRERFNTSEYGSYIQTDAAINPGNSGGALVNLKGELVGLNAAIVSRSGGYEGIGFAIPVDLARSVMEQIIEHGGVRRGLLGVKIDDIDPVTAEAMGMESTRGVLINSVTPDGPANKAGISGGDVVLAMDGSPVRNVTELRARIGATAPGTRVQLRFLRDGKERTAEVELGELTHDSFAAAQAPADPAVDSRLGLEAQELTPEIASRLGADDDAGVVVAGVRSGSEAARRGIKRGDIIREINRQRVRDLDEYRHALADTEPSEAVLILIERGRSTLYVGLRMPAE
jgi:serine protease Do